MHAIPLADWRGPTEQDFAPPEDVEVTAEQAHYATARERVLGDLDSFTESLNAASWGVSAITSDYETRAPGRLLQAGDAVVLHAALIAAHRGDKDTAQEALRILCDRHLERHAVRIVRLAAEVAGG
jgi:hypothetical protein